jgi:hypothetical protein
MSKYSKTAVHVTPASRVAEFGSHTFVVVSGLLNSFQSSHAISLMTHMSLIALLKRKKIDNFLCVFLA